jgi:hypothetical protein
MNVIKLALAVSTLFLIIQSGTPVEQASISDAPTYTSDGNLVPPMQYRQWIYLSSGLDMSYTPPQSTPSHSAFDNVFVNPSAYRSFLATGTWPDKTTLVLERRAAENPVSINKSGHTQAVGIAGLELHVKDRGTWSFYNVTSETSAKLIPRPADCYTCHEQHAAVDTTFVQFYPTLLPLATRDHTLSSAYLREITPPTAPQSAK